MLCPATMPSGPTPFSRSAAILSLAQYVPGFVGCCPCTMAMNMTSMSGAIRTICMPCSLRRDFHDHLSLDRRLVFGLSELQQRRHPIRIQADHNVSREFIGAHPHMRSSCRNDKNVAFGNGEVSGAFRLRARA